MAYREEADYEVTLTVRLSTVVSFAPMERDKPLDGWDAAANALGSLPEGWLDTAEDYGFDVAYPIDAEATKIGG